MSNDEQRPKVKCECGEVNRVNRARTLMTCWSCTKCYAPLYWQYGKPVGNYKGSVVALKLVDEEKPELKLDLDPPEV